MHFYGIMEPKKYGTGVTRDAAPGRPGNQNTGASPSPWAFANVPASYSLPQSDYNTYEIHVLDTNLIPVGVYFLENADLYEFHGTYVINLEKTIPVVGGGAVRMRTQDRNCRQMKNCGPTGGPPCGTKARTVDVSGAMPPPVGLQQPGLGKSNDQAGQWLLTDVVQVTCS